MHVKKNNELGTSGSHLALLRRQSSGGWRFKTSPGEYFMKPYLEKTFHKIGLVEWLEV
jgi:hypothetical protein